MTLSGPVLLLEVEGILIGSKFGTFKFQNFGWSQIEARNSRKIVANPTRLCSTALDAILAHLN